MDALVRDVWYTQREKQMSHNLYFWVKTALCFIIDSSEISIREGVNRKKKFPLGG